MYRQHSESQAEQKLTIILFLFFFFAPFLPRCLDARYIEQFNRFNASLFPPSSFPKRQRDGLPLGPRVWEQRTHGTAPNVRP